MNPVRVRLSRDELREVLMIALRAGQLMLENGANTARVEAAIHFRAASIDKIPALY